MAYKRLPKGFQEKNRGSNDKKKNTAKEEPVKIYHGTRDVDNEWQPGFAAVVKMLLSMRIASALWGIINDCDEVFNYWEPLHLFLYGEGFQTWEYSPDYSIRSYLYIYLHVWPAQLFSAMFGDAKIAVFTLVRLALGVFCLFGEYYAYLGVCKKINIATGRFFVVFTCFSTGMFIASTAFLPSSFSMACGFYALGAYLHEDWSIAIGATAVSTLIGWPFAAVLALPIVLDMFIMKQKYFEFLYKSFLAGVPILALLHQIDGFHFGKFVIAPWNIISYNILSGPGATIYGEEPYYFFVVNLLLNWNIAFLFVFLAVPLTYICFKRFGLPNPGDKVKVGKGSLFSARYLPLLFIIFGFFAWFTILSLSKHKEERFMFPVYPMLALLAACGVDAVHRMGMLRKEGIYAVMSLFVVVSLSRSFSLYHNYGSHMEIYKALHDELSVHHDFHMFNDPIRVCVGKEWHRFPSSFFLPAVAIDQKGTEVRVELQFLQSEFRGLLPKPFEKLGNLGEITRHVPSHMNNLNQEEPSRYVELETCDYVVDLDTVATEREPDYRVLRDKVKPVVSMPFLDRSKSNFLSRSFYVPFLSDKYNVFSTYTLYRKIHNH